MKKVLYKSGINTRKIRVWYNRRRLYILFILVGLNLGLLIGLYFSL